MLVKITILVLFSILDVKCNLVKKNIVFKKPNLHLFTVIKFHNDPCQAVSGLNGICFTSSECEKKGGRASGDCAMGFGVCCIVEKSCGSQINQNLTYFNFNSSISDSFCKITICPLDSNVCRLRLDFEDFTLAGPLEDTAADVADTAVKTLHSIIGECIEDTFIVKAAEGPSPPAICGTNTGQHMYTSLRGGCATISVNLGESTIERNLVVRTTQIPCTSEPLSDCLQYFTGTSGNIKSFNNGGTGTHLTNQKYTACIRRERGYCSICWSSTSFQMSLQTADNGDTGNKGMSEYDLDCGRTFIPDAATMPTYAGFGDYVEIPQGRCVGSTDDVESIDRYCGEVLACSPTTAGTATATPSSVCSSVYPFQIRVFTDSFEEITKEDGVLQLEC
ncbi:uncharacterized protein LOC111694750 isoform X2 [Eurytemora carolleeae]|uniref:uncharacterized protein LOC111694750 isoform X2 n=1 Tax=Eurytemora carolleeae TaxID=1294199 RepID=UPI000C76CD79|nr:uncharacterized protein LOC111694750 isoform X2 [Eurytemora carolleeae]|eukprot:XP_023319522.1 uncharacterized protein LOC111694750 isoform X2 [Eurytemora affinis]